MQRPFSISFSRHAPPGSFTLRLGFMQPLPTEERLGWLDLLKTFVEVAQCGALCGTGIAPERSGCVVVHAHVQGDEAVLELSVTTLDPAACSVLLNLCHWAHAQFAPLRSVSMSWADLPDLVPAPDADLVFPGTWEQLGFALSDHELVGQTIAVDIEFESPQSEHDRERINTTLGQWFKAANWGGYADELFPPESSTLIVDSPPMVSDELGISWYFESYHCSQSVFDGLLNCLARISATDAPIRQVTIGE
jgi:hypothetical protein